MVTVGNVIRITKGLGQGKLARILGIKTTGICTPDEFMIKVKLLEPLGRVKYRYLWYNEFINNPSKRNKDE